MVAGYGSNANVYFEPMNEPFGYSLNNWVLIVAVTGIGIVALPTAILASSFAEEFRERYEVHEKALEEAKEQTE